MDFLLSVLIIVAIVCVIGLWYISKIYFNIEDDAELILDTDVDMLAEYEINRRIKISSNVNLDSGEIAADMLKSIYGITANPSQLLIGPNITEQYKILARKRLPEYQYKKDEIVNMDNEKDWVFNLRDVIGKNCQIALVNNKRLHSQLAISSNYDLNELDAFLKSDLVLLTRDYITNTIKDRWEKLKELNNPNIINDNGSFLYMEKNDIPNVKMLKTDNGHRVNLLCKELQFHAFLKRMKKELEVTLPQLLV
jgi:hypothetical protein